ncbi:hypothetical protein GWK47_040433 [Chionoecetes opilio]|uniref:Uncharacterized protein n=1 Tax=Chionoecetes opilio TaxID=41210 RepID=A0A8J4YJJ2_CHIOP|nr:hypothetical protein GWK47_040433 [Chionoecetes opilio]
MEYECLKEKRVNVKEERNGRWKLRDADWDYFREVVSNEDWKLGENGLRAERGVDEMNEILLRKLNKVAEESIGRTSKRANGRTRKSWWNNEIDKARKERKQSNRKCRSLRKNRSNSEAERIEYERAWEEYKSKQKEVKCLVRKARVNEERKVIRELREKGEEGGREWYKFLRGEESKHTGNVEELVVNGRSLREKKEMARAVEDFWKDIGGVNEPDMT